MEGWLGAIKAQSYRIQYDTIARLDGEVLSVSLGIAGTVFWRAMECNNLCYTDIYDNKYLGGCEFIACSIMNADYGPGAIRKAHSTRVESCGCC